MEPLFAFLWVNIWWILLVLMALLTWILTKNKAGVVKLLAQLMLAAEKQALADVDGPRKMAAVIDQALELLPRGILNPLNFLIALSGLSRRNWLEKLAQQIYDQAKLLVPVIAEEIVAGPLDAQDENPRPLV